MSLNLELRRRQLRRVALDKERDFVWSSRWRGALTRLFTEFYL